LANPFVLYSVVPALGAIAVPSGTFFRRLVGRFQKHDAASPVTTRDEGWTFIKCNDPVTFKEWLGSDEAGLPFRPDEEPSLGSHLLVELFGCNVNALKAKETVAKAMDDAARESDAHVVAESFHEFQPYGVSGAVIIQESHYTIHTWPEHAYAAVDLFYCGGTISVHKAVEVLQERLQPRRIKFLVVRRGPQSEVDQV